MTLQLCSEGSEVFSDTPHVIKWLTSLELIARLSACKPRLELVKAQSTFIATLQRLPNSQDV